MTETTIHTPSKHRSFQGYWKQYSSWIILTVLVLLACLALIFPMLDIARFNHPSVDDYSYSVLTHEVILNGGNIFDLIKAAVQTSSVFYNSWQGLYTSAFVLSLQPGIFGESFYRFGAFFIIFMVYLSPCVLFSTVGKRLSKNRYPGIVAGLLIGTLYLICVPSAVEGIYWFNGVANYTLFFCLTLLQVALLFILFWDKPSKGFYVKAVLACILGFLISGGNHVTALLQILLSLAFLVCAALQKKKTASIVFLIVFVLSCIGLYLNLTSPGTAVRASAYITEKISPLYAISQAFQQTPDMLKQWFDLKVFFFVLATIPFSYQIVTTYKSQGKSDRAFRFPLLILLFSFGSICAMYCPTLLAANWLGPQRLNDVVYYYFLILLVVNAFYLTGWTVFKIKKAVPPLQFTLRNIIVFVILFGLAIGIKFSETNNVEAYNELNDGSVATYHQEAWQRADTFESSAGQDVQACFFTVKPRLIFFSDGEEDPTIWPNTDIARYYNLTSVTFNKCGN